jgi:hypothetical protein
MVEGKKTNEPGVVKVVGPVSVAGSPGGSITLSEPSPLVCIMLGGSGTSSFEPIVEEAGVQAQNFLLCELIA